MWTFASNFWNTITENWLSSRESKLVAELTLCLVIGIWSLPVWAPILKLDISDIRISELRAVVTPWLILVAIVVIQFLATRDRKSPVNRLPWKFHEKKTLTVGAYCDIPTKHGAKFFRITLKDVSQKNMPPQYESPDSVTDEIKTDVATISVSSHLMSQGFRVKKIYDSHFSNEESFDLPKHDYQEESDSVFFFKTQHTADGEYFFRCFVDHINPEKKEVELDIFFVWLNKST